MISETLGKVLDNGVFDKDAIHIAVIPVIANEKLYPAQDIGIIDLDKNIVGKSENPIGIVDPFIKSAVYPEQRFWMFMYPNTITSLGHDWEHPAFSKKSKSEAWMVWFSGQADLSVPELLQAAKDWIENGTYMCDGGKWEGFYTPDEFWVHYEIITGETVKDEDRGNFFTCSC